MAGNCPGFIGNRMLGGYTRQASMMILEGANPAQVDKVIYDFGLAMGPYIMGELSDFFAAGGMDSANALRSAITSSMLIFFVTLLFLYLAWKNLPKDEATRLERAKEYGEEIGETS